MWIRRGFVFLRQSAAPWRADNAPERFQRLKSTPRVTRQGHGSLSLGWICRGACGNRVTGASMTKKSRAHDQEAWTNATKICRLTARQVEMARALGMNPRKLPGLRLSPQRGGSFPSASSSKSPTGSASAAVLAISTRVEGSRESHEPPGADLDASAPEHHFRDPACQLSDLACYLVNLADDLQRWAVHGSIDPELLPEIREELQAIATALETGDPISLIPAIPLPPKPPRRRLSRHGRQERHSTMRTSRSDRQWSDARWRHTQGTLRRWAPTESRKDRAHRSNPASDGYCRDITTRPDRLASRPLFPFEWWAARERAPIRRQDRRYPQSHLGCRYTREGR